MSDIPNVVDHIVDTFFEGVQKNFVEWTGWPQSTIQQCKFSNGFTGARQRAILAKSDAEGLGIKPVDFFPDRLPLYCGDVPASDMEAAQ